MTDQTTTIRLCRMAIFSAIGVTTWSTTALAQLSTTPPAAELPELVVEGEQKPKRKKAPAAAQQSSTPHKSETSAPASNADPVRAPDTSDVAAAPTTVTTPVDQIASSVTVITSKEIEAKQYRTVPQALQSVPGLNIVATGGPGGQTSIFMRGTNSNHTKVLIDGIEISDPSNVNRSADLGQLLTTDIDRIEILRGPQSGLYGADAVGGVVAIYTKKGEGPPKLTAFVEGGSFGTFNQGAGARGSTGKFNYAFNIAHVRADETPVTPLEFTPPGGRRFDNSYDNWTYATKLGYEISPNIEVNAVARYTESSLFFTNGFGPFTNDYQTRTDVAQFFGRGEVVVTNFGGRLKSYFGVNYTDIDNETSVPPGIFDLESYNDGERVKYDWRSVLQVAKGHTVVVGAEHLTDQTDTDNNFGDPFSAEEWNRAAFAELQSEVFRNMFFVANIRHDQNETFGDHTTWRIAPAYIFESTGTKLKGSVGTAFKAPTLAQRFQDFPDPDFPFFGNPNLRPEESKGYDAGFEQSLLADKFRFGATYFYNDITDLIVSGLNTNINVGQARTEGVEVFAAADVSDDLRIRADYTYTEAEDELTGLPLLRRPRDKASLSAGWTPFDSLLLTGTILYVGEATDIRREAFSTRVTLPDFTLVNVAADYRLNDNMSLYGRIDNLFDRQYENPDGFEQTGIGAYVGVRFNN